MTYPTEIHPESPVGVQIEHLGLRVMLDYTGPYKRSANACYRVFDIASHREVYWAGSSETLQAYLSGVEFGILRTLHNQAN